MRSWLVLVGCAAAVAGCTSSGGQADRRADADTTASATRTSPTTVRPAPSTMNDGMAQTLDADKVFAAGPDPVWRDHAGPGPGTVQNQDPGLAAGSYRLQVRCIGGSLGIEVNGRRVRDVECATATASIPVCLRRRGLAVSAEWIRGPFTDLAWQLVPGPQRGC